MNDRLFGLRSKFQALRTAILSYLAEGIPERDWRIVQARHQQRMIAEEIVRQGGAKGIAFEREGDYHIGQKHAAKFYGRRIMKIDDGLERPDEVTPPARIVPLRSLDFLSATGEVKRIRPAPSQVVGTRSIAMEGKASSALGRELSVLEGNLGIDYEMGKDRESGIVYYVPIEGDRGGKQDG